MGKAHAPPRACVSNLHALCRLASPSKRLSIRGSAEDPHVSAGDRAAAAANFPDDEQPAQSSQGSGGGRGAGAGGGDDRGEPEPDPERELQAAILALRKEIQLQLQSLRSGEFLTGWNQSFEECTVFMVIPILLNLNKRSSSQASKHWCSKPRKPKAELSQDRQARPRSDRASDRMIGDPERRVSTALINAQRIALYVPTECMHGQANLGGGRRPMHRGAKPPGF